MRTRKTVVILISGKAGSGKTTVANMLKTRLDGFEGITTFRYSLASPIKFMAKAYFGWDGEKDDRGRKLLQDVGKVGREYDINIWVRHLLQQMDKQAGLLPFNFVVVDDWRFENESKYLTSNPLLEVVTIRMIDRGGLGGSLAKDVSENSLPETMIEKLDLEEIGMYHFSVRNRESENDLLASKLDTVLDAIAKQFILE